MERHRKAEPSESLGTLSGTPKDVDGPMFPPTTASDKISVLRELPCPSGHLLYKFPVIKLPSIFK